MLDVCLLFNTEKLRQEDYFKGRVPVLTSVILTLLKSEIKNTMYGKEFSPRKIQGKFPDLN